MNSNLQSTSSNINSKTILGVGLGLGFIGVIAVGGYLVIKRRLNKIINDDTIVPSEQEVEAETKFGFSESEIVCGQVIDSDSDLIEIQLEDDVIPAEEQSVNSSSPMKVNLNSNLTISDIQTSITEFNKKYNVPVDEF